MAADTIVARATPPGRGGVAIVRLSGPATAAITAQIAGAVPPARQSVLRTFRDSADEVIDSGLLLFFAAPNSFTGEDVAEFQCHGSPVVVDMLLSRATRLGARLAEPGEFSQRAFLNDRLDLAQAEAIADLIDATSTQAARAAHRMLQGDISSRIHSLVKELIELRVFIEAALDFPDEEVDFLADKRVIQQLDTLEISIADLLDSAQQGQLLRDGIRAVISGPANVGKSTLLNALVGQQRAIVTDIAGTTRDLLHESLLIDGLPVEIIDTAGLRVSDDPVEQAGIALAEQAIGDADLLLVVSEEGASSASLAPVQDLVHQLPKKLRQISIINKIDIEHHPAKVVRDGENVQVYLSAKTGEGLDLLRAEIAAAAGFRPEEEGLVIARRRHLDALLKASQAASAGRGALRNYGAGELLAEELRNAQQALGEITGEVTSDDLLGKIFSSFCIGK
ncbi:MAG: tRNA uridine-5-carboxymethylaminomethyl(34) synthesis GTPase MnmE [Gammaproteobacteria bacterium]|nr:MAG: tRNA uridine-5-carboxymethylaminomethyl(34) synthesis GTPase MnmE [Gammaproteobacteria bacterium]